MGKLFEILAVEPEVRATATKIFKETTSLFMGAPERFVGMLRTYFPLTEENEQFADESTERASSVKEELERAHEAWADFVDLAIQKEATNQEAEAVLTFGDTELVLPATALLNLEQRLQELRAVYASIPTLDPAERWEFDDNEDCYRSDKRITYKTKKVPKTFEAAEATKEHPAQIHIWQEDDRVGHWESVIYSGMLAKNEKRIRLQRIDELLRLTKQARQRANDIQALEIEIADPLLEYINQ